MKDDLINTINSFIDNSILQLSYGFVNENINEKILLLTMYYHIYDNMSIMDDEKTNYINNNINQIIYG